MTRFTKLLVAMALVVPTSTALARPAQSPSMGIEQDAPGSIEVVGHEPLEMRGMNAALAVHGDYAYIGSRTDNHGQGNAGVMVVDIKKPAEPAIVAKIEQPHENNEGETSRELRIWPEKNLLIVMNLFSNCGEIHGCAPTEGDDNYRFYDISGANAANPKFVAEYKPSENPHEFYLWDDPKRPGRALLFQSTPGGSAASLVVADISDPKKVKEIFKGQWVVGDSGNDNRLHSVSVSPDGTRAYFSYLEAGFYVVDTSDFAEGKAKPEARLLTDPAKAPKWPEAVGPGVHSAVPIWGSDYVMTTDEVYGEALRALGHGCPWGWAKFIDASDVVAPKVVAEFKIAENEEDFCTTSDPKPSSSFSAHNPTLTQSLAFVSWHSGGLRVIDVTDPTKPTEAASWAPDPLPVVVMEDPVLSSGQDKVVVWSYPIIQDGLIYVVDVRNGLFVLRYKGVHEQEVTSTTFLEGNSNLGDALKLSGAGNGGDAPDACTITGKAKGEVLRGTGDADVICGKGGKDLIKGLGGNDRLKGGAGNDTVVGGGGRDTLSGGPGRDTCRGGAGRDRFKACERREQ